MKKLNVLFFLAVSVFTFAQTITGKILSKEDGKPVPYARIGVENSTSTLSDGDGNYSIEFSKSQADKILIVDVGGYQIYKSKVADFINKNSYDITLTEKIRDIEEVKILPKKFVEKNWGVTTKTKSIEVGHNTDVDYKQGSQEIALFFRNNKKVKIQKININISVLQTDKPLFVRFVVYDKDLNSVATEDMTDVITADKIKDGTFSFDCSKNNIWMKDDFYVSLQLVNFSKGKFYLSGSFAGNKTLFRENVGEWKKLPLVTPALNIDVKVER